MREGVYTKYFSLAQANRGRFLLVNLMLFIPLLLFCFSLVVLIPRFIEKIESYTADVIQVHRKGEKLAVAVVYDGEWNNDVYVFKREDFGRLRRYLFRSFSDDSARRRLQQESLGYMEGLIYNKPFVVSDRQGRPLVTMQIDGARENMIEILFVEAGQSSLFFRRSWTAVVPWASLFLGFILLFGSLGGVSDYTQRIVFHETKTIRYLLQNISEHFWRSLFIAFFFFVVTGAIAVNIYFYIFIISSDVSVFIAALNFWMLVFFVFILFWIYPLLILNREESVWRVMKKSLFISFDNFTFTLKSLLLLLLITLASCVTLFLYPGFAGIFTFLNSTLKDISHRYSNNE